MINRVDVTLYTRAGCHLCEEAAAELTRLAEVLPLDIETIDIDADEATRERYNDSIPEIHVGGVAVSAAPLDWMAVRGAIDAVGAGLVEPDDENLDPEMGFSH